MQDPRRQAIELLPGGAQCCRSRPQLLPSMPSRRRAAKVVWLGPGLPPGDGRLRALGVGREAAATGPMARTSTLASTG